MFAIAIFLSSCFSFDFPEPIEYEGDLFPLTTTGENRLSFLLNGNVWVPVTDSDIKVRVIGSGFPYSFVLSASSMFEDNDEGPRSYEEYSDFSISGLINEDLLYEPLDKEFVEILSENNNQYFQDSCKFVNVRSEELFVNFVKFDRVNNILSGTFEVPSLKDFCGNDVEIKSARFDVKFNQ